MLPNHTLSYSQRGPEIVSSRRFDDMLADIHPQYAPSQGSFDKELSDMGYTDDVSDSSSDLSSLRSSPTPPPEFYPSPPPSQGRDDGPRSLNAQRRASDQPVDAPPAPKRRKIEPKPRTTQYLDLTPGADPLASDQKAQLDLLLDTLRNKRKIVVIAGAGISVSAGSMYSRNESLH